MDELKIFQGKRVLVTGHTGFEGSWLSLWLADLGADVIGLSGGVPTSPSLFETIELASLVRHSIADTRDADRVQDVVDREQPEFVFRLTGTVHVLEAARRSGSASVRAGSVIGGGDWAEDRLVPHCIHALQRGAQIRLRRPEAIHPWQHVLEPLAGYLALAARLYDDPRRFDGDWNFGPRDADNATEGELAKELIRAWGGDKTRLIAAGDALPETEHVRLSSDKAMALLPWRPQWDVAEAVQKTVEWHRGFAAGYSGRALRAICRRQIREYERAWAADFGISSNGANRFIHASHPPLQACA